MTLIELITEQSARLKKAGVSFGHGTGNAFDEAAWLVLWSLEMPLDALEDHANDPLDDGPIAKAEALIARRIESRVPAAYLTREAWLQNVPFYIDERSIVPRSLIAELLADGENTGILDAWLSDRTEAVLDLCTGNGSLAVIAAMAYPEIVVDAADISADALAIARINVDRHHLAGRITLLESDLWARVRGPYDLVLCNPPYVAEDADTGAGVREYEPHEALFAGPEGLDEYRRLAPQLGRLLALGGLAAVEIGFDQERSVGDLFRKEGMEPIAVNDLAGRPRALLIKA